MSNLREKAIEIAKQTSSESAFMCGYDRACQEYEEKVNVLLSALEQIANAPCPFNAFENEVFVSVSTDIARKAVSFFNAT